MKGPPTTGFAESAQMKATGATASMSVTTSITTSRSAADARSIAPFNSEGCSTRIPTAPMASAIFAKLTLLRCQSSQLFSVGFPLYAFLNPWLD